MNFKVYVILIIIIIAALAIILHTNLMGEHATYGTCIITSSSEVHGFSSSSEKSITENQCKQNCIWSGNNELYMKKISCSFQTITDYGWIVSPKDLE